MNRIVVLCCLLFTGLHAVAQLKNLSVSDSIRIKQLFFDGLRDKLNENYEKSNESFSRITAIDPNNGAAWYEIALLNFRQNKMPEAEYAITRAVAIDPTNSWYKRLLTELHRSAGRINALSPKTALPKDSMAMATLYIAQKKFAAASAVLQGIASTHQSDPLFLALSGDLLYENGNLPAALGYYKRALKITDELYPVWEKVLNIQILLGQYKQMLVMGQAALAVYPNQAILYYYMAFAFHREDQNKEALNHIQSALSIDGDNKELQALIFALQAEILIDERKPDAADISFEKAIALDPHNYLIMNNYAYYLALRGENLNKAVLLIDVAARALPEDASIADTYALILLKGGKYAIARTWIEKALQNNESENSVYLEHYGDILFLSGKQEEALVQWKKSKDGGNDSMLLKRKIDEKKYIK